MATLIPGGTNYAVNPSYETNLNGFAVANCTQSRTTAAAWVGAYGCRVTVTSTAGTISHGMSGQSSNAYRTLCNPGDTINVKCRVRSSTTTRSQQVSVLFRDGSNAAIGSANLGAAVLTSNLAFSELFVADLVAPANAVSFDYQVQWSGTPAVSDYIDVDGWTIRINESFDTYIDGDQGSLYAWLGTANNSASTRAAASGPDAIGAGGYVKLTPSLYRIGDTGARLEDLSADVLSGSVAFAADGDIHLALTATLRNPGQLTAYSDFVAPFLTVTYADGTETTQQVGLYVVVPGVVTYTDTATTGVIEGRGLEWLLSITELGDTFTVNAGVDYIAGVKSAIARAGSALLGNPSIPLSGKTLPSTKTWPPETRILDVVNELLAAVNYFPVHTDRSGLLKSFPRPDLTQLGSAASYTGGPGGNVGSVVTLTPDETKFYNRVVVSLNDGSQTPITAIAANTNPASPVSIPRLHFTKTLRQQLSTLPDSQSAQDLANALLQDASLRHVALDLTVTPDPARQPFEVYTLTLDQSDGTSVAAGNYYCTAWTLGFQPSQGGMKLTLNRVEVYQ